MRFTRMIRLTACVLAVGALFSSAASAAALKALIVDGQNNHDWKRTTPLIKEILDGTGLFEVEVATSPAKGKPMDDFAPEWSKYDVIVSNYNGASWPEATRKSFVKYMAGGGGLVIIHAADNAFSNWPEYNEMIAIGGWGGRNEKSGPWVYMKDGKWIRDKSPGKGGSHGRQTPYAVTTRQPEHPVMKGLPKVWMHCRDELYSKLRGPAKNLTVLASSYSDEKTRGSGREEPALMAIDYGKGRVFHTVLGHGPAQHKCVGFIVTLQRGTEWAATSKVTQTTIPSDFPTAEKESTREKDLGKDPKAGVKADAGAKGPTAGPIDYAAMVGYKAGQSRVAFTNCVLSIRSASPAKLTEIEAGLLKILQNPKATFDAKQYVCRMLRQCGTNASVPVLAGMLGDEKLAHMARYALTHLPGEKAGEALRADLVVAKGSMLANTIDSIARRGDRKAVAAIAKIAAGSDTALASAGIAALGRIGGPEAAKALGEIKPVKANVRVWADAYLKAADSLAAAGQADQAKPIYQKMYTSGPETMSRVAGLGGLARIGGDQAVGMLLGAMKDKSLDVQQAAGKFMMAIPGEAASNALADSLGELSPSAQMLVISALTSRGHKCAAPAVVKYVSAKDESVRVAAIRAMGLLGDAGCVGTLAEQLTAGGETTAAAQAALAALADKAAGPAMVKLLSSDLPAASKVELIEVLIARRELGAMDALLRATADADGSIAQAGAKALGVLGGQDELAKLVAMVLVEQNSDKRNEQLGQAIGLIASRSASPDVPAGVVIAAIAKADTAVRPNLVAVLPRIGGDKALASAREQLKSSDAETRKSAIRALSDWPTPAPADDLLAVAKADSGSEAILAIRGCVKLLAKRDNRKPAEAVAKLAQAMKLAKRTEEKRAILGALPNLPCEEAVKLAESLATDKALAREATMAAKKIKDAMNNPRKRRRRR